MPKPGQHYDPFGHLAFPRAEEERTTVTVSNGEKPGDRAAMERSVKRMVEKGGMDVDTARRLSRESMVRVTDKMRREGKR